MSNGTWASYTGGSAFADFRGCVVARFGTGSRSQAGWPDGTWSKNTQRENETAKCRRERFNRITAPAPRHTGFACEWRRRMAGPYLRVVEHAAAGSSPLVMSAPFASASVKPIVTDTPVNPVSARFPKTARLLKRAQFNQVHASGTRSGCAYFSVIALRDESFDCAKAGLTTPRRLGNAVVRNLLRRRMREAIRREIGLAQPGWAFVFHPRAAAADAPIEKIRAELARVFKRHGR